MGIQGLLPFLRAQFAKKCNIKDYSGKTIGVDAMCWMHKGAFACAQELVLGADTDRFVHYFLKMCEIMRFHQIKPVIVFDGARLPAKAKEEKNRQESREKARQEALALYERKRSGQRIDEKALAAACSGAIRITPGMISRLMCALQELAIHFIVAPFEADAQLAYMCRTGWVHAVISEDSDLLAYGCPNTFFKMDSNGDGESIALQCLQPDNVMAAEDLADDDEAEEEHQVEQADVVEDELGPDTLDSGEGGEANDLDDGVMNLDGAGASRSSSGTSGRGRGRGCGRAKAAGKRPAPLSADAKKAAKERQAEEKKAAKERRADEVKAAKDSQILQLNTWNANHFAEFCVISCGTDYKEPDIDIKGFGIKTAFKLLCQHKTPERMVRVMFREEKWKDKFPCPVDEYIRRFRTIVAVFWHHTVFDPRRGECVSISAAFPGRQRHLEGIDIPAICGAFHPKEYAARIAKGHIDARTLKERPQEPFTPAERACIERILQVKRGQQRDHAFQASLAEDSKRIQEATRVAEERAAAAVPQGTAEAAAVAAPAGWEPPGAAASGAQPLASQEEPREMVLRPSDISAMRAVMEEIFSKDLETPPKPSPPGSIGSEAGGSSREKANPFARRRLPGAVQALVAELPKRPRLAPASSQATEATKAPGQSRKLSTAPAAPAVSLPEERRLLRPEDHKLGGYARETAVAAVLAQRRGCQLEALDPEKDKSKLTGFFKVEKRKVEAPKQEIPKKSKLDEWNPRPWEKEEEEPDPYLLGYNPIALRRDGKFRNRGNWETGGA